jgi:hypothetical protein
MTVSENLDAIVLTPEACQAFRAKGARADCALVLIELQLNELKRLVRNFAAIQPSASDADAAAASFVAAIVTSL